MVRAKRSKNDDPSYRTLKADYYPVQRVVNLGTASAGTKFVLDVARQLSVVNHRLYRQGKTYQVKIDIENRPDTTAGPAQYEVWALTDTWYVQKAWQLARAQYLKATADEREMMNDNHIARWEDFRVTAGIGGSVTMVPYQYSESLAGAVNSDGEFTTSQITLADGSTVRTFTWGSTPSASEFALLQEYDKSGDTDAAPESPAGTGDTPYAGTDSGVHNEQMVDLAGNGNLPPYNRTAFTDNVWVKICTLDNSGVGNPAGSSTARMSTGFFNAPCGLVVIKPSISHQVAGDLRMTVKSGDYKGCAAMNMGA
jgi:hypothetical protein